MKIAVFIKSTTFHENHGGLETQNKTLIEGLKAAGNEITVYTSKIVDVSEEKTDNGIRYKFLDIKFENKSLFETLLNFNAKEKAAIKIYEIFKKEHEKEKFDICISQSTFGLGVIRNKKVLGIPVIAICHGTIFGEFQTLLSRSKNIKSFYTIPKNFAFAVLTALTRQREFILNASKVICVSEYVKKNVMKETGLKENMLKVIYNGVSSLDFDLSIRNNLPKTILYVGRIEEEKGLSELIDSFVKLDSSWKLRILGDGPFETTLKKKVMSMKLDSRVYLEGRASHSEVIEAMKTSHIFVLPTKRIEGFPVTLSEAMIAGLPVVAINKGGVGEGVIHENTGYLANDLKEFDKFLLKLSSEEDLRKTFEKNSLEYAHNNFTSDIMVMKYMEVIKSVL